MVRSVRDQSKRDFLPEDPGWQHLRDSGLGQKPHQKG